MSPGKHIGSHGTCVRLNNCLSMQHSPFQTNKKRPAPPEPVCLQSAAQKPLHAGFPPGPIHQLVISLPNQLPAFPQPPDIGRPHSHAFSISRVSCRQTIHTLSQITGFRRIFRFQQRPHPACHNKRYSSTKNTGSLFQKIHQPMRRTCFILLHPHLLNILRHLIHPLNPKRIVKLLFPALNQPGTL